MKKILCAVLCAVLLIGSLFLYNEMHKYKKQVEVVKVEDNEVFVVDNLGNEWTFYGKGYTKGEKLTAIFKDNETPRIYDDWIVGVE